MYYKYFFFPNFLSKLPFTPCNTHTRGCFLYTGLISENFYRSGNVPVVSMLLHIYVSGDMINGLLTFKIFTVISLYPHEFVLFKVFDKFFLFHE
jgi:hypothetical protein